MKNEARQNSIIFRYIYPTTTYLDGRRLLMLKWVGRKLGGAKPRRDIGL